MKRKIRSHPLDYLFVSFKDILGVPCYNHRQYTCEFFLVLTQFRITSTERKLDYYHKKVSNLKVVERHNF